MTIVLDIKPEVRAELMRRAAAHGVDLDAYAATLLEEAANTGTAAKKLSQDELSRTLEDLAQFSYKVPVLSDEALSRASLYQEHD